jgi:hypothetical protein
MAHMWFDVAVARMPPGEVRDLALKVMKIVAAKMTPEQIAEAQRLAREWRPKAER